MPLISLSDQGNGFSPEPIRLRTLVQLRWVAVAGQLAAVASAWGLGVRFPLVAALIAIGIAVSLNLLLALRPRPRVSRPEAMLQLGFDLIQISTLLALTGGISNPFALLVLVPVTIAATALDQRNTAIIGALTVVMISLTSWQAIPLRDLTGAELRMPHLLALGHWVAVVIGVVFFAGYAHRVATEFTATTDALFATRMALAREQKLQHLGGIVAAAAHEMGTPLATIKLVSSELADELPDRPDLAEDLALLVQSADRCRDIMRSMGQAGKDDLLLRMAPLEVILEEAASPHADRGKQLLIEATARDDSPVPMMQRDPGVIHGLRNLIQNAVDFAQTRVRVTAEWSRNRLVVTIADDGPGFTPAMLARVGDPFLTTRRPAPARGEYEGMGLGLFIAKALLERSGARLGFANGTPGARITVDWPRDRIEASDRQILGKNPEIRA